MTDILSLFADPGIWMALLTLIVLEVVLGVDNLVFVALPTGSASRIKTSIARPEPLMAPISKGQQVGVLKVGFDQQSVLDIPLMALDNVQQAGLLGRAWDALRLWIK